MGEQTWWGWRDGAIFIFLEKSPTHNKVAPKLIQCEKMFGRGVVKVTPNEANSKPKTKLLNAT